MTDKTHRIAMVELKKFVAKYGREQLNLLAFKLKVSERTMMRWYKQQTRPTPTERERLLKIIKGYGDKVGEK